MKVNPKIEILGLFALFLLACSSADPITEPSATRAAQQLVAGEEVDSGGVVKDGISAWKVEIKVTGGAVLEIYFEQDTGTLMEIEDKEGPFNYTLPRFRAEWLSHSEGFAKAMEQKTGALVAWNLEREDGNYRYEFYVHDAAEQLWEVKLLATTGELLAVDAKTAVD